MTGPADLRRAGRATLRVMAPIAARGAVAVGAFLLTLVLARAGGTTGGYLVALFATTTLISTYARFGLDVYLVREIGSGAGGDVRALIRRPMLASSAAALVLSAIGCAGLMLGWDDLQKDVGLAVIVLTLISAWPLTLCQMLGAVLRGLGKPTVGTAVAGGSNAVALVLLMAIAATGKLGFALAFGVASLLSTLICLAAGQLLVAGAARAAPAAPGGATSPKLRVGSALTIYLGQCALATTVYLPVPILNQLGLTEAIARFKVAERLVGVIGLVVVGLSDQYAPRFARAWRTDAGAQVRKLFVESMAVSTLVGGPIVLGLALFAGPVVRLLGVEGAGTVLVLQIMLAGQFINLVTGPCGVALVMGGAERKVTAIQIASLVIAITAYAVLAPAFGLIGVAAAFAIAAALPSLAFAGVLFGRFR